MSINFNNSNNIFYNPLNNISGFKAVVEQEEKKKNKDTQDSQTSNTSSSDGLNILSAFEQINSIAKKDVEVKAENNKVSVTEQSSADSQSEYAVSSFESIVQSYEFTPAELMSLYAQYNLQVSNLSPESKTKLDTALRSALFNAFSPVVTMDNQSENAIANFKSALNSSLTKDEMVELFIRFSREISINFPQAWKDLESILNNMEPNAFVENTSMDNQSENAIANFKSNINPNLTKDDLVELFVRFSREISVKYPDAWKELSNLLTNALSDAYVPDNSIDNQSINAISNFRSTLNSDLTRDEMVELFVRFSREISIKFPKAWNQLESALNNMISSAFVVNNTMDAQSENAIANFKTTINESMTKDQMIELFVRFSREISINYPQAWKELESILSQEVDNAFKPVTTIDDSSKDLASEFVNKVSLENLSTDELETLFGDYLKLVSLKFVDAKKKIESAYQRNTKEAELKDKGAIKEEKSSDNLISFFKNVANKVNNLDAKVQDLGFELANADNKDEINNKITEIDKIQGEKDTLDLAYNKVTRNIFGNKFANNQFNDNYKTNLNVSKDRPNDRNLEEKEMQQITRWDMLRQMRRKEVLGILNDRSKDELVEQLTSVPKFILKRILLNQVHDQQCEILMTQRYPEALLRDIPRSNAKKQLPKAEDMLPLLLMTGQLSCGQNGADVIKGMLLGSFGAQTPQNQTRAKEEIVPFIADLMLNKPPKASEVLKSTANIGKPKSENFDKMVKQEVNDLAQPNSDLIGDYLGIDKDKKDASAGRRDNKVNKSKENKNRLPRLELLSIGQLLELANDKVDEFTDDETKDMFRAKRGTNKEVCEFLEAIDGVDSLASAKLAVNVLYNYQQQVIKQAVLPLMDENDMVKLTLNHGKSKEQMVKDMPWYTIQDLIKELPKVQMMDSFKMLDKSEMIGAFRQLPSQTIASIAFDTVDRTTVSENLLNKKGFAAA